MGFLARRHAVDANGVPDKVSIDKSGADKAGVEANDDDEAKTSIEHRQCKYLKNIVEPDHRFVKKKLVAAPGFQTYRTAKDTLTGLELVHMIRKGQVVRLQVDQMLANSMRWQHRCEVDAGFKDSSPPNTDQLNALAAQRNR